MIGKLKKDSAPYTHHCSGEGREKREGKSLCGGNHITSLLYLREERKEVLTHSCKGILHLHTYAGARLCYFARGAEEITVASLVASWGENIEG